MRSASCSMENSWRWGIGILFSITRRLLAAVPGTQKEATGESNAPMVSINELVVEFPGGKNQDTVVAVNSVSLDINRHEILGLVGESGSGKSTLGRAITRLVNPTSGKIYFNDEEISHYSLARMK